MKEIILIYITDGWHSRESQDLMAVATTVPKRNKLIRTFLRDYVNDVVPLPREAVNEAIDQIEKYGQTQGLNKFCGFELYTETISTNKILTDF